MQVAQKISNYPGGYGASRVMFSPTRSEYAFDIHNSEGWEHHPLSPDHPGVRRMGWKPVINGLVGQPEAKKLKNSRSQPEQAVGQIPTNGEFLEGRC